MLLEKASGDMGRGKIEMRKIENRTNRQVTYSKRRNGIFKKAQELTVLCDAKVSLIMMSNTNTGKMHEYISPGTTTKSMYDEYQKLLGVDLWKSHFEKMQENLRNLREINNRLRTEIRRRMGDELHGMSCDELKNLQENIAESVQIVRERKYHVIKTQTDTYKKKVKSLKQIQGDILMQFETKCDLDPRYVLDDSDEEYKSAEAAAFANGDSTLYAFRLQANQQSLEHQGGYYDLRLASI